MAHSQPRRLAVSCALIADIGATNARFALVGADGEFRQIRVVPGEEYASLQEAVAAYVANEVPVSGLPPIKAAALAVAAPIAGDRVTFMNSPWSFSIGELGKQLAIDRAEVVNDFTAVALAAPHLKPEDRQQVGGGTPVMPGAIGVLGPGSGLGVSGLIPVERGWRPLSGEGGHVTMAPATARESRVLDRMRERFDHVSAERVLSGPGLVNLYNTLAEIDGVPAASYTAAQISDPGVGERDAHCREAVAMFCAMLGTVAGNLALTLGALGGIYVAGGIVPKLGATFAASGFRERFEAKGRSRPYLTRIPTYVITHPFPAFVGLTQLLAGEP